MPVASELEAAVDGLNRFRAVAAVSAGMTNSIEIKSTDADGTTAKHAQVTVPAAAHVEHLHRGEFFQHGARRESGGALFAPGFEGDLQRVGEEGDKDVGFDAVFALMMDRSQG